MRFFYVDSALVDDVGHHANTCRVVTNELRRRGIPTIVAGSVQMVPALRAEFNAQHFLSVFTYKLTNDDPIAGWMTVFHQGAATTAAELARLPEAQADDVVYVNSAMPAQFMAIVLWLEGMPKDRRPRVVIEFGVDAGLEVKDSNGAFTFHSRDPRQDARSTLYRYIGRYVPQELQLHLSLMTFDRVSSQVYEFVTGLKVGVLPLPQTAFQPPQRKAGKRPVTFAVLGHQRIEKGFKKLPPVLAILLERHPDFRMLVHNATPSKLLEVQQNVRKLAAQDSRVKVDERPAGEEIWKELFAAIDVVVCPYTWERYVASYSAIAVEALANGLPIVAPDNTSLSRFTVENGGGVVTFSEHSVAHIADAMSAAMQGFDELAEKSFAAAVKWNAVDRHALLVDRILGK